jgi:ferric-dicitrate binding protein FerR (iron transport regulator)
MIVMKVSIRAGCIVLACALFPIEAARAQPATLNCTSGSSANTTQTVSCAAGLTIVAEDGAQYTLRHRAGSQDPSSVELTSKALLLEVSKKPGGHEFRVDTPQAIAAVRGTKWAVDVGTNKTSVFVDRGRVIVGRPTGTGSGTGSVTLGPGEGVDVEPTGPLTVKRWPPARVSALMARLGQ